MLNKWRQRGVVPLVVLGGGVLAIVGAAMAAVALSFAVLHIRPFAGGGSGDVSELKLVESNATVYLTFYHPGSSSDPTGGNCETASGVRYYYRRGSELINYCTLSSSEQDALRKDSSVELVSQFGEDQVVRGGVAVNQQGVWKNGSVFPLHKADTRRGQTYWLQIPGYDTSNTGVPVIDYFAASQTQEHRNRNGHNGQDYRYRVDIAVKGDEEEKNLRDVLCAETTLFGACVVNGVNVYYGNPFVSGGFSGGASNGLARTPRGFPRFLQYEGEWASQVYGQKCTGSPKVAESGCGPASLANVVLYYLEKSQIQLSQEYQQEFGTVVNPGTIATISERRGHRVCNAGTAYAMFNDVGQKYFGLRGDTANWSAVVAALKRQTPVIAAMGPGYFTTGGHFVTLYDYNEATQTVYVSDTFQRNRTEASADIVRSQAKTFIIMYPR